jgi:hypothetical protein
MSAISDILRTVALSRNRQLTTYGFVTNADEWFQYHANMVIENWYFYLGYHNIFMQRFEKEDESVYIDRVKNATIENHIMPIIDAIAAHLYNGDNAIKRWVSRKKKPDQQLNEFFDERVWHPMNVAIDDRKALNALVTGYTIIQRQLVDIRTGVPFPVGASNVDKSKYGVIRKIPLDSQYCVPLPYLDENGVIDPTRWGAILSITDYDTHIGDKTTMDLMGRPRQESQIIEYVDSNVWLKWIKPKDGNKWEQITVGSGEFKNRNPYKRVDVPFSLYRNTGDPFYLEGDSDVVKLKSLNMELTELANGDKDTIRYHQYPILVGYGGADLPNDFARTKNAFVGVSQMSGKNAKFEYLTWDGNLEASQLRQDQIRRSMSLVSGKSLITRGFLKDIGQIRSGPPLKALFTSDRTTMSRKVTYFTQAEMEDMRADVQFFEKNTGRTFDYDPSVRFNVEFNPDFLGIDKLLEEEIRSIRAQSGTEDPLEILREVHPEWTDDEIKKAFDRAKEQKEKKSAISKSSDKKGLEQTTE